MNNINSIAFQEDFLTWVEMSSEDHDISIKKVVTESLPVSIDHQSLNQTVSTHLIATRLNEIAQQHKLTSEKLSVSIPGKFTNIRRIAVDEGMPVENLKDFVSYEFEKILDGDAKSYQLYMPDYSRERNGHREILGVAIRKEVLAFFENISSDAQIEFEIITPACFTIDEFFRTLHPEIAGEVVLMGWQRRGFDLIIADSDNFLNYQFKPYTRNLDSIEQIDNVIIEEFNSVIQEIKHSHVLDKKMHDISEVYLFGFHFNSEWVDELKSTVQIPLHIFNLDQFRDYRFKIESPDISFEKTFQIIEPVSMVFSNLQ
jgi:hypothetical protein